MMGFFPTLEVGLAGEEICAGSHELSCNQSKALVSGNISKCRAKGMGPYQLLQEAFFQLTTSISSLHLHKKPVSTLPTLHTPHIIWLSDCCVEQRRVYLAFFPTCGLLESQEKEPVCSSTLPGTSQEIKSCLKSGCVKENS